jgi:hypothetical protein
MPKYRCVFQARASLPGDHLHHEAEVYAPDDATAVVAAHTKRTHPEQIVEVWHGERLVHRTPA